MNFHLMCSIRLSFSLFSISLSARERESRCQSLFDVGNVGRTNANTSRPDRFQLHLPELRFLESERRPSCIHKCFNWCAIAKQRSPSHRPQRFNSLNARVGEVRHTLPSTEFTISQCWHTTNNTHAPSARCAKEPGTLRFINSNYAPIVREAAAPLAESVIPEDITRRRVACAATL